MKGTIVLLFITLSPAGQIEGHIVREYPSLAACKREYPEFMKLIKRQQYWTATRLMGTCVGYMRKLPEPKAGA